jgi:hypothetical protein
MKLIEAYNRFRASGGGIVGESAKWALRDAKTLLAFREAESEGLVRLRCEPEQESYLDAYGEPEGYTVANGRRVTAEQALKELLETLERDGAWWACAEWFDGEEWQMADSCGMHTGYRDPLCPFQNCYIAGHMRSALDALQEHRETAEQTQLAEVFP